MFSAGVPAPDGRPRPSTTLPAARLAAPDPSIEDDDDAADNAFGALPPAPPARSHGFGGATVADPNPPVSRGVNQRWRRRRAGGPNPTKNREHGGQKGTDGRRVYPQPKRRAVKHSHTVVFTVMINIKNENKIKKHCNGKSPVISCFRDTYRDRRLISRHCTAPGRLLPAPTALAARPGLFPPPRPG